VIRLLALLLIGCGSSGSSEDEEIIIDSDIESIRVEPSEIQIETIGEEPTVVEFKAMATTDSGEEVETEMVSWTVSNLSAGSIDDGGRFESSTLNGGIATITANHVGIEGTATITVVYKQDVLGERISEGLPAAFDAATATAGDLPAIEYPQDGVTVPRNLNGLAFTWDRPSGDNVSRIRLQSGITDMRIYTEGDEWISSSDTWATIAASNTAGSVDLTLESGFWDGTNLTNVSQGPGMNLTVNRLDARGSVLYWVARSGGGGGGGAAAGDIMRIPFGSTASESFWTFEDAGNQCVGCHTLVEAAGKMVVTHAGVNGNFSVVDISDPDAPALELGTAEERRATFHAAHPDGELLLAVLDGQARVYSLIDGSLIQTIETGGRVSHPDWSPDGDSIVLVRVTGTAMNDMNFEGGEIIQLSYDGNSFGSPEVLVTGTDEQNNYYPAYSPDGEWIVWNRAVRTEIRNPDGSMHFSSTCYANPSAELWLMARDGTYQTRLDAANGEGELQNSFPRWGPLPDDDVLWLAFSSTRPYAVDPNGGVPQIWVSAIEPEKIINGDDPSSTPFWLPAQDSQSDNHLAIWWSK
jgi:WD40 repeat protein